MMTLQERIEKLRDEREKRNIHYEPVRWGGDALAIIDELQVELDKERFDCPQCGGRLWKNGAAGSWCMREGCDYTEKPGAICDYCENNWEGFQDAAKERSKLIEEQRREIERLVRRLRHEEVSSQLYARECNMDEVVHVSKVRRRWERRFYPRTQQEQDYGI